MARKFLSRAAGPTGLPLAMEKIGDFSLVSGTNLTFDNIPQTFSHLRVQFQMQSNRTSNSPSRSTGGRVRFNGFVGDANGAYSIRWDGHQGSTAHAGYEGGHNSMYLGQIVNGVRSRDNAVNVGFFDVPFYSRTDNQKSLLGHQMGDDTTQGLYYQFYGLWYTTLAAPPAITRLDIIDDVNGALGPRASATLYGIA